MQATKDPHYLEVGKEVLENLRTHAQVDCGFAAIQDVRTGRHEDQMDSFVLSETFKYLYLLFSEDDELLINVDDYIFTTEAHLLPLSLSLHNKSLTVVRTILLREQSQQPRISSKFLLASGRSW